MRSVILISHRHCLFNSCAVSCRQRRESNRHRRNLSVSKTKATMPPVSATSGFSSLLVEMFLVAAGSFALGYYTGRRRTSAGTVVELAEELEGFADRGRLSKLADMAETEDDFKMVLVVRNDLKMGKGKIAAQCGHATLGLYKKVLKRAPLAIGRWEDCAQVKVVVKIDSEDDLIQLQDLSKSLGIAAHTTVDAGRTQIAPNSRTVMALLGPTHLVDEVTGHLKLL